MSKSFTYVLVLAAALVVAPSLLAQTVYYIPIPETGGGDVDTQVEFHGASNGVTNALFIPEDTPAKGLVGTNQLVNNFFRPNVFDAQDNITSGGLLVLTPNPPITFNAASFLVNQGNENTAWSLPVLTPDQSFAPGATAHLTRLGRDTNGGVTNLQVVNFGSSTANCSAQVQRPKGSFVGAPFTFTVPAGSSSTLTDLLAPLGYENVVPVLRAMVTCDQAFYPFATFATPDRLNVRVSYPLDAPSKPAGDAVFMDIPGTFFVPVNGNSDLTMELPLKPNQTYRVVIIDYDLTIDQFDFVFDVLLGMYHTGGPRFNKTLYFGTFIRGLRHRYILDMGSPLLEVDLKYNYPFQEGGRYHIHIVYDGERGTISNVVSNPQGDVGLDGEGGIFNFDIADRGNPVVITWGVGGVADGAYFPPIGWRFANLHLVAYQ